MTVATEDNEVFFAICPRLAPADHVVDLELIAPATVLAFPAIALQNFHLQLAVTTVFEPKSVGTRKFSLDPVIANGAEKPSLSVLGVSVPVVVTHAAVPVVVPIPQMAASVFGYLAPNVGVTVVQGRSDESSCPNDQKGHAQQ